MWNRRSRTTDSRGCISSNSNPEETTSTKLDRNQETFLGKLHTLDVHISSKLSFFADKGDGRRSILIALEISGHGIPWIIGVVLAVYRLRDYPQQFAVNFLLALLLDLVVVGLLKVLFQRKRPAYNEMDMFATVSVDNFSFPSGHATRVSMIAALFTLITSNVLHRVIVNAWAIIVAVSRVMLGRHHVSDVLFGAVIGLLQYWVIIQIWLPLETCQHILALIPYLDIVQ